jgi:DNA-binding transcriptional ArsR family regulator
MNDHNDFTALARLFKVLAHPTRLCILTRLNVGECSVSELQKELCCRQASVSQHLALLRRENLVKTKRTGKSVLYELNRKNQILRLLIKKSILF